MGNLVEITAADGGRFNAYVAMPEGGSGPGLVLLQEAFGVTQFMRDMADRFASDGYVVTVPDLYWRIEAGVELTDAEFDRAMDIYRQFDLNLAIDDIKATIGALRAMPEQRGGVGAVGFCLGGRLAAMAAARTDIDCAVAYYGVGITDHLDELEQVRIPLGFHFGTEDQDCAADIAPIAALAERHDNVSLWMYNKAGHGFANPHRGFFSAAAEELAYIRTLAIIRAAIGPKFDLEGMWGRIETGETAKRLQIRVDVEAARRLIGDERARTQSIDSDGATIRKQGMADRQCHDQGLAVHEARLDQFVKNRQPYGADIDLTQAQRLDLMKH
ncbi:Carboxymethylenebutenolidase [Sphingomonas paucimobilis]|uniref:Dienelactone hydrolase family protein n=1 Tax=Novosphingobium album (ex Liu et al. 2023) TaxID=3031130 RepID=A0ABT5WP65_9SPHN|nr:dienelactone hydrolase family protein [Novosphingobium album (ex Liu et al. 2023)]EZP67748.1 Carboxymethylenebutenolidase [Sphingomonas paucimobilis]MDE8651845.1 dienelactone hydrolase family protein [Novosphingobium album (ex Liu et al. 2023)]